MNVTVRLPRMTREQFLHWAARQEAPFEYDGSEPVPMTGGTLRHALLCSNILFALRQRLDGLPFNVLPEAGVATADNSVRYPDVAILPADEPLEGRLMREPVVLFEVVSPSSERLDRTIKLLEYRAVASIRRYVIVDGSGPDIDVFSREAAGQEWQSESVTKGETLALPEVGIEIPVDDIFQGIKFSGEEA